MQRPAKLQLQYLYSVIVASIHVQHKREQVHELRGQLVARSSGQPKHNTNHSESIAATIAAHFFIATRTIAHSIQLCARETIELPTLVRAIPSAFLLSALEHALNEYYPIGNRLYYNCSRCYCCSHVTFSRCDCENGTHFSKTPTAPSYVNRMEFQTNQSALASNVRGRFGWGNGQKCVAAVFTFTLSFLYDFYCLATHF